MAITVAPLTAGKFNIGNKKVRMADVTFTGSYATGGEAITPASVGMKRIMNIPGGLVTEAAGQTTAWSPHWDVVNGKLKLFGAAVGTTGMTEHAAAAYAAATVGHLVFIGE
jgi:hypothetical protein